MATSTWSVGYTSTRITHAATAHVRTCVRAAPGRGARAAGGRRPTAGSVPWLGLGDGRSEEGRIRVGATFLLRTITARWFVYCYPRPPVSTLSPIGILSW